MLPWYGEEGLFEKGTKPCKSKPELSNNTKTGKQNFKIQKSTLEKLSSCFISSDLFVYHFHLFVSFQALESWLFYLSL